MAQAPIDLGSADRRLPGVRYLPDATAAREVVVGLRPQRELCSVVPGQAMRVDVLRSSWQRDTELLDSGVAVLALYEARVARDPEVARYLTDLTGRGADVRVRPGALHRTILVDRRLAVVAAEPGAGGGPAMVVEQPVLVESIARAFAEAWRTATPVGIGPTDALSYDRILETLRVLADGPTDEAAARRLGVSVRTVRRRVADLMDVFGARSRFELAVRAVRAGWL